MAAIESNVSGSRISLVDTILAGWIVATRVFCVAIGVGVVVYLVIRAIRPGMPADEDTLATVLTNLKIWPTLVWQTLAVVGIGSATCLIAAAPISFLLFRTDLPGRQACLAALLFLACMPVFVSASAILSLVGIRAWEGSWLMAGLIHGWLSVPLAILLLGSGYRGVDRAMEESALLETDAVRVWLRVDLPAIRLHMLAVVALQTWLCSADITVTDLLAVRTFGEHVYISYQLGSPIRYQVLLILPYLAIFGALLFGLIRAAQLAATHDPPVARAHTLPLRGWRWPLGFATAAAALLSIVPIVPLARQVGGLTDFVRFSREVAPELWTSIRLAGLTAAVVLPVLMGAADLAFARTRAGFALRCSLLLLLALPTPGLALALIDILNRPGPLGAIYDTIALPVLGQSLRWFPLVFLIILPGVGAIPRATRDAARIDGCGLAQLHRHILWPQWSRLLAIAAAIVVLLVFGEVTANVLLCPAGVMPLSIRFFTLVHYGLRGQAAAICLLALVVLVIPWTLLIHLLQRRE